MPYSLKYPAGGELKMTEVYQGDWNQITGDKVSKEVQDPYHPKYPDAGAYRPSKYWGFVEKPVSDYNQLKRVVEVEE